MVSKRYQEVLEHVENIFTELDNNDVALRNELINRFLENPLKPANYKDKYATLVNKKIINIDESGKKVISIYPFICGTTNKKVVVCDSDTVMYAGSAIDAFGIHHTLEKDIEVITNCQDCSLPISFVIKDGKIEILSCVQDIRVLFPNMKNKVWTLEIWSQSHFFKDSESLQTWVELFGDKEVDYIDLSLQEAYEIAKKIFAR